MKKYLNLGVAVGFLIAGILMLDAHSKSSGYIFLIVSTFEFAIFIKNMTTQYKPRKK